MEQTSDGIRAYLDNIDSEHPIFDVSDDYTLGEAWFYASNLLTSFWELKWD